MRFELDHNHTYRELTGQTFTRLFVVHETRHPSPKTGGVHWHCLCECGNTAIVRTISLLNGEVKSCGCWHNKNISVHAHDLNEYPQNHGLKNTLAYNKWGQLLQKCYSPSHENYRFHGAIGHTVCAEWRNSPKAFHDWYVSQELTKTDGEQTNCIMLKDGKKEFNPDNCFVISKSESISLRRRKRASHIDYEGLIGKKIGHIQVLEEFERTDNRKYKELNWLCVCDCGKLCLKRSNQLHRGGRLHCGCWIQTYEWSDKHPCCVNCKGTGREHAGNGLCHRCFSGLKRDPNYQPSPLLDKPNRWSFKYECCVDCGTTERKHHTHGRCTLCRQKKEAECRKKK